MNRVTLMGNLGTTPELRKTTNTQNSVTDFRLATNETFKDGAGKLQKRTTWLSIVVWGRRAEVCAEHLTKGSRVIVEGRLQSREFTDKEGVKRQSVEVVATNVEFLDRRETPEGDTSFTSDTDGEAIVES